MASQLLDALQNQGTHAIGNLNSLKVKTVAHGAIVTGASIDNFTIGELDFNADGERIVRQLSNKAKKGVLVASPETRYLDEDITHLYNAVGERARCVIFEENYTRFDTSAFTLNAAVENIKNGMVAHFDATTKKFIISKADAAHADYADSANQFVVVNAEDDVRYTLGLPLVRLEVTKA